MSEQAAHARLSHAAYVLAEAAAPDRHEWLNGEIFAMAGGTPEHAALAAAVVGELRAALGGRPCRVYGSDLRIRVLATGLATYPDVSVVCERIELDPEDDCAATNPVVLCEILSDATEAYDRGEKFAHYRRIPSLREYVMVSQKERRIEIYRRSAPNRWELTEARSGERVELASLDCAIAVDEIYRNPLALPAS